MKKDLDSSWMRMMFDAVPEKYRLLNRILTVGQDELWRRKVLDFIEPEEDLRILDICAGTGDLSIKLAQNLPRSKVFAADFSSRMLLKAKGLAAERKIDNISFIECDAANLGLRSDSFDYVTISFGFRNLSYSKENLKASLGEIHRVLKEKGKFIVLETSQPGSNLIRKPFHFYASRVVPRIGLILSGDEAPYAYLGGSIVKFFDEGSLNKILTCEGFRPDKAVSFLSGMILLSSFSRTLDNIFIANKRIL